VTISIVANNGAQSFSPNPATAVSGDSLVWRNNDFSVHRIVLDDGSLDTGDINPGTSSPPMTLTGAGGGYHCAIHPTMVGTIAASAPVPPPPPPCPTIVVSPSALPNVTQGVAANLTLTATGGTGPFVFSVVAGSLPAGLSLSSGGVLSGTPAAVGSSTFTVRATNAGSCFTDTAFTLTVVAAVPAMPQVFVLLLAALLIGLGWWRLRQRA
jgi:hypothetical protein